EQVRVGRVASGNSDGIRTGIVGARGNRPGFIERAYLRIQEVQDGVTREVAGVRPLPYSVEGNRALVGYRIGHTQVPIGPSGLDRHRQRHEVHDARADDVDEVGL